MPAKRTLRKIVDEESEVRCTSGLGFFREEVWEDESGKVVRYNLAFINHFLTANDNGRVLGYDSSHGFHHRHFKGSVTPFEFKGYQALLANFFEEMDVLRKEKP